MYTETLSPASNQRDEQYVLLSQNNFPFISIVKGNESSDIIILNFVFLLNEATV